jgi:hypothetical protein
VRSGTAGQPVSQSASDFSLKTRSRQGQGKVKAEQSRAELAWRAVIKDYFWKQSLLHEAPRACGEWLDLAPRPSPPSPPPLACQLASQLACFSFHRCSCSMLVFVCCLLLLRSWSHDSFLDRGAYLITNSPSPHPIVRRQTFSPPAGPSRLPSSRVSSWASCSEALGVVLGQHVTSDGRRRQVDAGAWQPCRPKKHQRHARRWSWTASCSASLTAAGMGCKRSALSSARECHSCESVQSLGREGGRENHGVCFRAAGV